jgi:hypothetical protein
MIIYGSIYERADVPALLESSRETMAILTSLGIARFPAEMNHGRST